MLRPVSSHTAERSTPSSTGERPTLVVVQTYRDELARTARLAERLPSWAVVALAPPTPPPTAILSRVPQWLEHHRAALADLDLAPPYTLVGWSFGGVLAIELTRSLRADGLDVAYVGLIDTIRPRIRPVRLRDAIPYHVTESALLHDPEVRRAYAVREAKIRVGRRLRFLRAKAHKAVRRPLGRPVTYAGKPTDPLVRSIHRSYLNYRATPLDFPVTIFSTKGSARRSDDDPSLRWAPYLRAGFTVRPIAGGHYGLWEEPHIDVLARELAADLDLHQRTSR
jgi:thioesterase domain-containing protein